MIDTHCHIHDDEFNIDAATVIGNAQEAGVTKMICIGTTTETSQQAINTAQKYDNVWAAVGVHPHDAGGHIDKMSTIKQLATAPRVIAIGECGLDYYYLNSSKQDQAMVLREQLAIAQAYNLPVSFHNRGSKQNPQDAFDDLWQILEDYPGIRGVIHSFTGNTNQLEQILDRGLYVALNGIITFSNDESQLAMAAAVPLEKMLLETDAPFLTPSPFRGTINEPKNVRYVAEFLASIRPTDSLETITQQTTRNAEDLFGI